jgi:hypothetical protein
MVILLNDMVLSPFKFEIDTVSSEVKTLALFAHTLTRSSNLEIGI